MTEKDLLSALSDVDEGYIEHAATALEGRGGGRRRLGRWQAVALIAACVALIVAAIVPIAKFAMPTVKFPLPFIQPKIHFSAEEIAGVFNSEPTDGPTKQYGTTYAPDITSLRLSPVTEQEYYPIYQTNINQKRIHRKEFTDFIQQYLEPLAEAANLSMPKYQIRVQENYGPNNTHIYSLSTSGTYNYYFGGSQTVQQQRIRIRCSSRATEGLYLNGEQIVVDQTQSDDEIIASLSRIREKFCTIFGESFSDTKIVRYYDEYSEYGVSHLQVYFYNEADHPMNSILTTPVSNYVSLYFDNSSNYADDIVSKDKLIKVEIEYVQMRTNDYAQIGVAKSISLQQAEEFLAKGYCFMSHACPICAEQQDAIEFSEYDFVTIRYLFEGSAMNRNSARFIPFYVFYKNIGVAENGNQIYAFTYVPAVEVSGIEEYFQNQIQYHPQ